MLGFEGCLKSKLLDQDPQQNISDATYWNTTNDLKLYVNNLYQRLPVYFEYQSLGPYSVDDNSDNMVFGQYNQRLNGETVVPASGGGWSYGDWSDIRSVNYFLDNYSHVQDPINSYATYVGEAYFFKAYFYFDKLKAFGALPWLNKAPSTDDTVSLLMARLPRNVVVDSILADLDKAIEYLLPKGQADPMRINKEFAVGFKSRVALYEGTWEKYHEGDPFGVSGQDGSSLLKIAAEAAGMVIQSGKYALDNKGQPNGYWALFNQTNYSQSNEVMFWRQYSFEDQIIHHWNSYSSGGAYRGITKSLVDAYLCADGKPIAVSSLYQGDDSLSLVVKDRDPRLAQTIYTPGDIIYSAATYPSGQDYVFKAPLLNDPGEEQSITGYQLYKSHSVDYNQGAGSLQASTIGLLYMRYAEVLLNYAEAKAELGILTQADLDESINVLRDRVNMPHLRIGDIASDPNWQFPHLSPLINEVRRERRVELACEGFRLDDIFRWAAADKLIHGWKPLGAKWKQWATVFPGMEVGKDVFLNKDGYIEPFKNVTTMQEGYNFDIDRDYLLPIPDQEITLNPNLIQNPGWE
jgi:hypothetical protein